jgi:hypothetical protein
MRVGRAANDIERLNCGICSKLPEPSSSIRTTNCFAFHIVTTPSSAHYL